MKPSQAAEAFAELFVSIYRQTCRRRNPREYRPSGEALAMLQHLRDSGPLTVTEAARHFGRSQAATSERIERLIRRGLLERIKDERDRRRRFVWLTGKAEEILRLEFEVLSGELLGQAMETMHDEDRKALVRGMAALVEASGARARRKGRMKS